ncbi:hypothetical protein MTO96_009861 [Rhipicephalus appendiculatus]
MSTGIPYLGSKISLISKSEIRYEGILYTIDTKESTVALAKVRSFGTEDRPTDRPVAPRDEVYEYIIFRAHDIKDLRVSEPPKPQSTLPGGLTNDPAIVQHSATPVGTGAAFSAPAYSQPPASYGPVDPNNRVPSLAVQLLHSGRAPLWMLEFKFLVLLLKNDNRLVGLLSEATGSRVLQGQAGNTDSRCSTSKPCHHSLVKGGTQQQRGRRGGVAGGSSGAAGARPRQGAFRTAKPKEPLKFDREYDFEQANAEFQELENKLAQTKISDEKKDDSGTETQVGDNHEDDDVVYYDKNKSFFDNISCEAIERSKGVQRIDWRQERKLNHETFGISANNWMRRNAWRGRGGGFWRGGQRGGQRGGRGGGNRGGARPRNGALPRDGWSSVPRADASSSADPTWP